MGGARLPGLPALSLLCAHVLLPAYIFFILGEAADDSEAPSTRGSLRTIAARVSKLMLANPLVLSCLGAIFYRVTLGLSVPLHQIWALRDLLRVLGASFTPLVLFLAGASLKGALAGALSTLRSLAIPLGLVTLKSIVLPIVMPPLASALGDTSGGSFTFEYAALPTATSAYAIACSYGIDSSLVAAAAAALALGKGFALLLTFVYAGLRQLTTVPALLALTSRFAAASHISGLLGALWLLGGIACDRSPWLRSRTLLRVALLAGLQALFSFAFLVAQATEHLIAPATQRARAIACALFVLVSLLRWSVCVWTLLTSIGLCLPSDAHGQSQACAAGVRGGQQNDGQTDLTQTDGTLPDGTRPHGKLADGPSPDGTLPDGTLPDGALPSGRVPIAHRFARLRSSVAFLLDRRALCSWLAASAVVSMLLTLPWAGASHFLLPRHDGLALWLPYGLSMHVVYGATYLLMAGVHGSCAVLWLRHPRQHRTSPVAAAAADEHRSVGSRREQPHQLLGRPGPGPTPALAPVPAPVPVPVLVPAPVPAAAMASTVALVYHDALEDADADADADDGVTRAAIESDAVVRCKALGFVALVRCAGESALAFELARNGDLTLTAAQLILVLVFLEDAQGLHTCLLFGLQAYVVRAYARCASSIAQRMPAVSQQVQHLSRRVSHRRRHERGAAEALRSGQCDTQRLSEVDDQAIRCHDIT